MNRADFEKRIQEKTVDEFLNLTEDEILKYFGEEYLKVIKYGMQNNAHHQYTLYEHILRTVDGVKMDGISKDDFIQIRIAAFFHDMGKPEVAKVNEKTGETQYIGHAQKSAVLAKRILERIGYDNNEIAEIQFLIQNHDEFISIKTPEEVTPQKISKILKNIAKKNPEFIPTLKDYKKLLVLCRADAMAQREVAKRDGKILDTKENKIKKINAIETVLEEALILEQETEIERINKQIISLRNKPKPIEKKGKIVNQKQIDMWMSMSDEERQAKIEKCKEKIKELKKEERRLLDMKEEVKVEDTRKFIEAAFKTAKKLVMGKDETGKEKTYFDVMLAQRIEGPTNAGSSYNVKSAEELYERLISQEWEETTHPDVMPGCRVFKTKLAGLEGIIDLDTLPDDIELYAIDPKGTGKVEIGVGGVPKKEAKETYLIIGKEEIDGKEEDMVFTFHPGEPIRPSQIETKLIPDGKRLTKKEAQELGFGKAKYLSEEMVEKYRDMSKTEDREIIDIAELAKQIGIKPQEKTLPNGKTIKTIIWDQETLLKAVELVRHLSSAGKPVGINGAAPAWLVSAICHTVHPCPVSVYVPQIDKYVDISKLQHGEPNPEGEVKFKTTVKGDSVLLEYEMDLPEGITTYDEGNLPKVVVPEIPKGKAVYISGRGPNYLTVSIAEAYAHTNSSVSLNQPGIGYTCSITHSRAKRLGDLTKDPIGKEEVKEELAKSQETKKSPNVEIK